MLNFILCDDNQQHNVYLKKAIEHALGEKNLEGFVILYTDKPTEVIDYSRSNKGRNNVYVLDIDFPDDINGIKIAEKIRKNDIMSYIIFVSAHQEYSMLCYKTKTFDFLLKPLNFKVINECILRLYKDYNRVRKEKNPAISIKSGSKIHTIKTDDIIYIEKYRNVAIIHTTNGTLRSYESLENMQFRLQFHNFYRCHKSYLINIDQIKTVSIDENYVYMNGGGRVLLSRNYKKGLIQIVKDDL